MNSINKHFKSQMYTENTYKGGRQAPEGVLSYKLSSNENALGTSPKVKEALDKISVYHLYPDNTDEKLRNALYEHHGRLLHADQFLCGNSGSEILEIGIRAFVNPGDEVILSNPCFIPYYTFSKWAGAKVIDVPLKGKGYDLDVDGILNAITKKTRIIFITSPNNPTGTYIPKHVLDHFFDKVPENVLVIFDEVYYQYADAEDFTTAIDYVKRGKNVLAINSFSKAYGMPSLRLGYGYTTQEISAYLRLFQRPFLINNLTMTAGLAALFDYDFIDKTIRHNLKERTFLENEFDRIGIDYTPTQGNFHLIHSPIPPGELVDQLFDRGVMVRDVASFGAPGKVRITIGTEKANKVLISALEEILK